MTPLKESYFLRSIAYLAAATKVHKLVHDFTDPQVRASLLQLSAELEQDAKSWQLRAETLLEVTADPEGSFATIPPPKSDTEPPSPAPKTLPSERQVAR